MATELLRPGGIGRVVVYDSDLEACVAAGYIVIEPTSLPVTHDATSLGLPAYALEAADEPKEPDEPDEPTESAPSSANEIVPEAIIVIAALDTPEEVKTYAGADERKGVQLAVAARVDELTRDADNADDYDGDNADNAN